MKMIGVDSTAILAIGYESQNQVLYVEFKDGQKYRYFSAPEQLHADLMNAASIGSFFDREIKKKGFRFEPA